MDLPAPFSPEFLADMPYDPSVLFFDRLEEIDREKSRVVCRMPTDQPMPFTDDQRVHSVKHPKHINGALMIQLTGNLGFIHAFHLENLRHQDGWIGFGTHIRNAVFRKLVGPGEPMICSCTLLKARRGKSRCFTWYKFEFRHEGQIAYESEQSAMWLKTTGENAIPLSL